MTYPASNLSFLHNMHGGIFHGSIYIIWSHLIALAVTMGTPYGQVYSDPTLPQLGGTSDRCLLGHSHTCPHQNILQSQPPPEVMGLKLLYKYSPLPCLGGGRGGGAGLRYVPHGSSEVPSETELQRSRAVTNFHNSQ